MQIRLFAILFTAILVFSFAKVAEASSEYTAEQYLDPVFNIPMTIQQKSLDKKQSMILVHGLGVEASKGWDAIGNELAKEYHLIVFDLPGYGSSQGKFGVSPSPKSYAGLIMRIVSQYAKSKIIYVGHSMGAAIGLKFVSQYPHLVDKSVFIAAAGVIEKAAYVKFLTRMERDTPVKAFFAGVTNIFSEVAVEFFDMASNEEVIKRLLVGSNDARVAMNLIQTDFSNDIKNLKTHSLIIWGDRDPVAPLRTGQMLNYHMDHSKLVVLPGSKHSPHIEKPAQVAGMIQKWLLDPVIDTFQFPEPSDRKFSCDSRELKKPLTGSYGVMEFEECSNIILQDLTAREIRLEDSVAKFNNVKIISNQVGLKAEESTLIGTNVVIEAPLGIRSRASKLDLAGAIINYQTKPIRGEKNLIYWTTSYHIKNSKQVEAIHEKQSRR